MIGQAKASRLAREGFDLWQAGNLEESAHSEENRANVRERLGHILDSGAG